MILLLSDNFIKQIKIESQVRNIVGTMDIQKKIDLNHLARFLRKSIYEPE
jgi:TATA-box binding protein (TBP) (component of TFIID and TFIIIB)